MKEPYNILYLANSGDIIGGGEISLVMLIDRLSEKFHPVVVCPDKGSLYDTLNMMGIETHIITMKSIRTLHFFSWVKTVCKILRLIKTKGIDLIHSNGSRAAIFGGVAAILSNTPQVWHVRIADSDGLLDTFLAKVSKKIIAISNAVKKRFIWLKDIDDKVAVIYNGIDLDRFNPGVDGKKIREGFNLPDDMIVIGAVGRMDWYKGYEYFLAAADMVADTIPQARFLIVGDGEHRKKLEEQVRVLHLDEQVIFTGTRQDIPEILAGVDLFVQSSVSEGFGRAAAEAMACEKSVVATRTGGLSEVVEDGITGILVQPRNGSELANAIVELINDKRKAKNMGIAGRKRVEELFSIERNVICTEELYESMLSGRNKNISVFKILKGYVK